MKNAKDKREPDLEKYKLIRERWDKEDELLLARTGVFLTANSILGAALGLGFQAQCEPSFFPIGVAGVGLALSILWLLTSLHSFNIIWTLFHLCKDDMPHGLKEVYKIKPPFLRPNAVFCKWIPGVVIFGWATFIVWGLWNYYTR